MVGLLAGRAASCHGHERFVRDFTNTPGSTRGLLSILSQHSSWRPLLRSGQMVLQACDGGTWFL